MGLFRAGFDVTGVDINQQPNYPFKFMQMSALDVDVGAYEFMWASPPCFLFTGIIPEKQRLLHGHKWNHENLIPPMREKAVKAGIPYIIENVAGAHKELVDPIRLCGTMFDLRVFRHRLFESNGPIASYRRCDHRNKSLGVHSPKFKKAPECAELPEGWTLQEKVRSSGASAGHKDHYYVSPAGKKHRSLQSALHSAHHAKPKPDDFVQFWPVYGMTGQRGTLQEWSDAMGIDWMPNPRSLALAIPPAYSEYLGRQILEMMGYTLDYEPISYAGDPSLLFG